MSVPNIQDRNVGNRGDVVKHVALVALADLLRSRNAGLVRHVETHTFRLHAPLPDPDAWAAQAGAIAAGHARERYRALEAPWIARGAYRCSAGLVADALGEPVRLLLAEAHGPTRDALAAALAAEAIGTDGVVAEAEALATLPAPTTPAPLLVHVDPFDHPLRYWPTVEHLLATWRHPDHDAVVFTFGYDRGGPLAWPPPPRDLVPVGRLDALPYGLAAWASPGLVAAARETLRPLGWALEG
jgi:hypothetical protein